MKNNSSRLRTPNTIGENEFDLGLFLKKIASKWYVFLISLFIFNFLAFLIIRYSTSVYKINAKVLINDDNKSNSFQSSTGDLMDLSALMGVKSNVDNEAEVLKTRVLVEKLIRDLQLNATFYKVGNIRDVELNYAPFLIYDIVIPDSLKQTKVYISKITNEGFTINYKNPLTSISDKRKVKYGERIFLPQVGKFRFEKNINYNEELKEEYVLKLEAVDERVDNLRENINIGVTSSDVSTIDLSLQYPVPSKGERILTKLIENYTTQNIREKNRIADSTITFIDNRLVLVGQELGNIEGNIQKFKQVNKLADLTEQSKLLVDQTGDALKAQADIETQITIIDALTQTLKYDTANTRVISASLLQLDPVFADLVDKYNSKLLDLDRISLSSTSTNPFVSSLKSQVYTLRTAILNNLNSNKNSLIIQRKQFFNNSGRIEGAIKQVPAQERVYLDLARQQQIKQELYIYLLQKREETAISKTSNISNSLIIDPSKAEYKAVSPKPVLIFAVALCLGFIFPVIRIILKDTLNKRILTKEDITSNTNVPVIGEISHNKSKETLVMLKDGRSAIAEQFRALRTNLKFYLKNDNEKIVLVTSSMPGEGKSFLSINFANILAVSGKKVVIMELDLRKPKISSQFGIDNKMGFSNYIITKSLQLSDIVKKSGTHENLFIIPSGPIPPNPAELILDERTQQLMAELKTKFDFIVIDSPPVGLVTDAQLLSSYSDITLYVVRQKYTFKEQLALPEELYQDMKMKNIGIIVNDIEVQKGYGYSYKYGYGKTYGDYNGYDDQKTNGKSKQKSKWLFWKKY